jgi:hypothetical protein
MHEAQDRRGEQRLYYDWPVRFSRGFGEHIFQGRMANLSSTSAAFTCPAEQNCAYPGREVVTFFSVPRLGSERQDIIRTAQTCRVDRVDDSRSRVVVRFAEPLPFRPLDVAGSEFSTKQELRHVSTS